MTPTKHLRYLLESDGIDWQYAEGKNKQFCTKVRLKGREVLISEWRDKLSIEGVDAEMAYALVKLFSSPEQESFDDDDF